jgi:rsbT co-antagonist protein RsbR
VPLIDTAGAQSLLRTVDAARLMGTHCKLVGLRPEIAQTLVALGIDLSRLPTSATLQQGLNGSAKRSL